MRHPGQDPRPGGDDFRAELGEAVETAEGHDAAARGGRCRQRRQRLRGPIAKPRVRQPQHALREALRTADRRVQRIGHHIVDRRNARGAHVVEPGELDRRAAAGEHSQPLPGTVTDQIDEDVDAVASNAIDQRVVVERCGVAPFVGQGTHRRRRVVAHVTHRVAGDVHGAAIAGFEQRHEEMRQRTAAEARRYIADLQPALRIAHVRERRARHRSASGMSIGPRDMFGEQTLVVARILVLERHQQVAARLLEAGVERERRAIVGDRPGMLGQVEVRDSHRAAIARLSRVECGGARKTRDRLLEPGQPVEGETGLERRLRIVRVERHCPTQRGEGLFALVAAQQRLSQQPQRTGVLRLEGEQRREYGTGRDIVPLRQQRGGEIADCIGVVRGALELARIPVGGVVEVAVLVGESPELATDARVERAQFAETCPQVLRRIPVSEFSLGERQIEQCRREVGIDRERGTKGGDGRLQRAVSSEYLAAPEERLHRRRIDGEGAIEPLLGLVELVLLEPDEAEIGQRADVARIEPEQLVVESRRMIEFASGVQLDRAPEDPRRVEIGVVRGNHGEPAAPNRRRARGEAPEVRLSSGRELAFSVNRP